MKALWILQSLFVAVLDVVKALLKRRQRGLLLLLPVLLVIAALLAVVSSSGALAPFLYPLF